MATSGPPLTWREWKRIFRTMDIDVNKVAPYLLEEGVLDGGEYMSLDYLMPFDPPQQLKPGHRVWEEARELLILFLRRKNPAILRKFVEVLQEHQDVPDELAEAAQGNRLPIAPLLADTVERREDVVASSAGSADDQAGDAGGEDDDDMDELADSMRRLELLADSAKKNGGRTRIPFLHLVVLGAPGTGKTSLLRSLLNRLFQPDLPSTDGMRSHLIKCHVLKTGVWEEVNDKLPEALQQLYCSKLLLMQDQGELPLNPSVSMPTVTPATTAAFPGGEASGGQALPLPEPTGGQSSSSESFSVREEVAAVIKQLLSDGWRACIARAAASKDFSLITVADLAGQQLYQCMQPLLMTPNTQFLLTFDASQDMKAPVTGGDEVRHDGGTCSSLAVLQETETNLCRMLSWLDMLLLHLGDEGNPSRAILVGCKKDELRDGDGPAAEDVIRDHIKSTRFADGVNLQQIFVVDNTKSGLSEADASVEKLRRRLNDRCQNQVETPILWLRFAIALTLLRERSQVPWITLVEASHIALRLEAVASSSLIEDLLRYQQRMGVVAYFPRNVSLRRKVIIDIQFIMDVICALLQPIFREEDEELFPSVAEEKVYNDGLLTLSLAKYLLRKHFRDNQAKLRLLEDEGEFQYLLSLLEELLVLVKVSGEGLDADIRQLSTVFYLLPCAARDHQLYDDDPAPETLSPPVCFTMPSFDHLPPSVYWRFVATFITLAGERGQSTSVTGLSLRHVCLQWNSSERVWLHIRYCKLGIKLQLERLKGGDGFVSWPEDGAMQSDLLSRAKECLLKIVANDSVCHVVHEAFLCACGSDRARCFRHGLLACPVREPSEAPCPHLIRVHLKCQVEPGAVPFCPIPRIKPTRILEDAQHFWLGLKQHETSLQFVAKAQPTVPTLAEATSTLPVDTPARTRDDRTAMIGKDSESDFQLRLNDPWSQPKYRSCYPELVSKMDPSTVAGNCFGELLITRGERDTLQRLQQSPSAHNQQLLQLVEKQDQKGFATFREILRFSNSTSTLDACIKKLDTIGPDPMQPVWLQIRLDFCQKGQPC